MNTQGAGRSSDSPGDTSKASKSNEVALQGCIHQGLTVEGRKSPSNVRAIKRSCYFYEATCDESKVATQGKDGCTHAMIMVVVVVGCELCQFLK